MITLGLLKTEFTNFLVNQDISSRIGNWAFWVHTDILAESIFWWNKKQGSLTTVASTAEYFLTHRVNGKDVLWMGDSARQSYEIKEATFEQIYRYDSTPTETGDPVVWAYVEQSEVQAINTATTVSIVSSDNTDLAKKVIVRGKVSSVDRYEVITSNGTTTVAGLLSWDVDSISSISMEDVWTGVMTATTGATTIASVPPGLQRIQCPRIRLWRVPSSALTLPYIYYQNAIKPINDGDIIDIPNFAFPTLLKGIEYYGHKNNGDIDFARLALEEYNESKKRLVSISNRELNVVHRKETHTRTSDQRAYTLPRTISGTVV